MSNKYKLIGLSLALSMLAGAVIYSGNKQVNKTPVFENSEPHFKRVPLSTEALYEQVSKHVTPLRDISRRATYCSSSNIAYRGTVYTVTNRHCCDPKINKTIPDGMKVVGDEVLRILHVSQRVDLCILESHKHSGLKIARKAPKRFDRVFSVGFPHGRPLTIREGRFQYIEKACIEYGGLLASDRRCVKSYVTTTVIRPGNSGSPMFALNGAVIGISYAGNDILSMVVTREQLLAELAIARAKVWKARRAKSQ